MKFTPNSSTVIVRNIIIINILLYLITWLVASGKINLDIIKYLGLYFWKSPNFYPHQLITYMFLHGGLVHLFFNMFAIYIFGRVLENVWGEKRFLIYYMITGIGAGIVQLLVNWWQYSSGQGFIYDSVTIGASGAVFGLLLAFGLLFPNTQIMLLFPPIPIKAKYFVIIYAVVELYLGVQNFSWDNIAHFAHLGGMVFGYILIKYWNKNSRRFY